MKIKKNRVVNPMTRITYDKLTKEEVVNSAPLFGATELYIEKYGVETVARWLSTIPDFTNKSKTEVADYICYLACWTSDDDAEEREIAAYLTRLEKKHRLSESELDAAMDWRDRKWDAMLALDDAEAEAE